VISYGTIVRYVSEGEFTPTEKGLLAADAATNAALIGALLYRGGKVIYDKKKKNLKGAANVNNLRN